MKKRLLALAMIFTMVLSQMSLVAFADGEDAEESAANGYEAEAAGETAQCAEAVTEEQAAETVTEEQAVEKEEAAAKAEATEGAEATAEKQAEETEVAIEGKSAKAEVVGPEVEGMSNVSIEFYLNDKLQKGSENDLYVDHATAYYYVEGEEDYRAVDLVLKSAAYTDSSFGTIYLSHDEDGDYWLTNPQKLGKATIEFTFNYKDNPEKEFEYKCTRDVLVVKDAEGVSIGMPEDVALFPGDTINVYAQSGHDDEESLPENLRYEWSLDEKATEAGCSISGNGVNATISIPDSLDTSMNSYFEVTLTAYDGSDIYDTTTSSFSVDDEYFRLFYDTINEELLVGESIVITPVLKYITKDNREYTNYTGSAVKYDVYMEDEEGNKTYSDSRLQISDNGDGSFTLNRLSPESVSFCIVANFTDSAGSRTEASWEHFSFPDYEIEFDADNNLFNGGTLDINADVNPAGNYDYQFKVYKITGTELDEEGYEDYTYEELNNAGDKFFTVSGNQISLNGTAIWNEVKGGYIDPDYEGPRIKAEVEVLRNGVSYGTTGTTITVIDSSRYYEDLYGYDLMIGYETSFDFYGSGEKYDAENPDGISFDYRLAKVTCSSDCFKLTKNTDDECWELLAVKKGTATVTFTVIDEETGNRDTISKEFRAVTDSYTVDLDRYEANALPGDTVSFTATGSHEHYKNGDLNDFTYKCEITSGNSLVASSGFTGNKLSVKIREDITDEELDDNDTVEGIVRIVDKNGNVVPEVGEEFEIYISDYYYTVTPDPDSIDKRPAVGSVTTIEPKVIERRYENGVVTETPVTDFKWIVRYNVENLTITDESGAVVPSYDDEEVEQYFEGSLNIKREYHDYASFSIEFYREDPEYGGMDYLCTSHYYFDEFYDIEDAGVSGIKNVTYTGKAITLKPILQYQEEDMVEGRDYEVTYKNNKAIGTASVYFKGIGDFYGTMKMTFKILPKGTALKSVKPAKKSMTVKWKKQAKQTTGYQIQYGLKKNFKGAKLYTVKKNKTVSAKISKLKSKKTYYVRIRTFKKVGKKYYYSTWSKAKKVKIK